MISQFILNINTVEKRLFWSLLLCVLGGVFLYSYFVQATILTTVERRQFEEYTSELNARIGEHEAVLGSLKSEIGFQAARTLGFMEPSLQYYVARTRIVENTVR